MKYIFYAPSPRRVMNLNLGLFTILAFLIVLRKTIFFVILSELGFNKIIIKEAYVGLIFRHQPSFVQKVLVW